MVKIARIVYACIDFRLPTFHRVYTGIHIFGFLALFPSLFIDSGCFLLRRKVGVKHLIAISLRVRPIQVYSRFSSYLQEYSTLQLQ